jgi:mRNA interferase RelE/StbE
LAGYHRLRVGRFRIIFSYAADETIEVLFIEERSLVYEAFEAEFIRRLRS